MQINTAETSASSYKQFSRIIPALVFIIFTTLFWFNKQSHQKKYQKRTGFIQILWEQIQDEHNFSKQAINTKFIKSILNGDLPPLYFTKFTIQQVYYNQKSIEIWKQACRLGKNEKAFYDYCQTVVMQLQAYTNGFKDIISLNGVIKPTQVNEQYVDDQLQYFQSHTYHSALIIHYACMKLYVQLSLKNLAKLNRHNVYYEWLKDQGSEGILILLEQKLNQFWHIFDRQEIKNAITKFAQILSRKQTQITSNHSDPSFTIQGNQKLQKFLQSLSDSTILQSLFIFTN